MRPPREAVETGYQEAPKRTKEEKKAKPRLELCGLALSEDFREEKFDLLDAWIHSNAKGAEAGKFELTAGKFYEGAKLSQDAGFYGESAEFKPFSSTD